jgi:polygalacturonase
MTIGTVPPHPAHNCIKDIYFRDIIMNYPFKAIYVKTNPGSGYGLIKNITYENF